MLKQPSSNFILFCALCGRRCSRCDAFLDVVPHPVTRQERSHGAILPFGEDDLGVKNCSLGRRGRGESVVSWIGTDKLANQSRLPPSSRAQEHTPGVAVLRPGNRDNRIAHRPRALELWFDVVVEDGYS